MRWLAILVVLISPTVASGQDYTFGDWARDQGYEPGDVMPHRVGAESAGIDSLDGIGDFDWTTTPTRALDLSSNQISGIESGDFSGLTNLAWLLLNSNQISSIESGAFSGLTNLTDLHLQDNQLSGIGAGAFNGLTNLAYLYLYHNAALTELNLAEAHFSNLIGFDIVGNDGITSVSLRNAVISPTVIAVLLDGGAHPPWSPFPWTGIGELDGITEMDLSGVDFIDITDLEPLYAMDDLTDLWLVDTKNLDATDLDVMLDNLETIEGTDAEGILYMTEADFDAFNAAGGLLAAWDAEPGHHVEYLSIGDVNHDTEVNRSDLNHAHLMSAELSNGMLSYATLINADLSDANLTDAHFWRAILTDANLNGAVVGGVEFRETTVRGFTAEQLYSTASYQSGDLAETGFAYNDLTGWKCERIRKTVCRSRRHPIPSKRFNLRRKVASNSGGSSFKTTQTVSRMSNKKSTNIIVKAEDDW